MDASKVKKLQDYASFLVKQAESKELHGNSADAARDYVKLVDILLLLANEAKDQASWQQIIERVEFYQKKVKALGSDSEALQVPGGTKRFEASNDSKPLKQFAVSDPASTAQNHTETASTPTSLLRSFRKIPGLMGRNQSQDTDRTVDMSSSGGRASPKPSLQDGSGWAARELPQTSHIALEDKAPDRSASPSSLPVISENERLRARIAALEANEGEYIATVEEIKKQMEDKLASMVQKTDYDAVQLKLMESVPKYEYEKLRETLKEMVPKERLREAERYVAELEARLETSVPRTVLTQIEEYTSLLVANSAIPLIGFESQPVDIGSANSIDHSQSTGKRITLDIDPRRSLNPETGSIFLEIKMKEAPTARKNRT